MVHMLLIRNLITAEIFAAKLKRANLTSKIINWFIEKEGIG